MKLATATGDAHLSKISEISRALLLNDVSLMVLDGSGASGAGFSVSICGVSGIRCGVS